MKGRLGVGQECEWFVLILYRMQLTGVILGETSDGEERRVRKESANAVLAGILDCRRIDTDNVE